MHFDEINGNIPILIYPDELIKRNERLMHLDKFRPICFLDLENQIENEHVSIVYNEKVYFIKLTLRMAWPY